MQNDSYLAPRRFCPSNWGGAGFMYTSSCEPLPQGTSPWSLGHKVNIPIFFLVTVVTTAKHTGMMIKPPRQNHSDMQCPLSFQAMKKQQLRREKTMQMGLLSPCTWLQWEGHVSWWVLPGQPSLPEGKVGKNRLLWTISFLFFCSKLKFYLAIKNTNPSMLWS